MSNLKNLLSGTAEAYYWLGFLMADGYLSKSGRLRLVLSNKDRNHLNKYAKFIEFDGKFVERESSGSSGVQVMDVKVAEKLREVYNFTNNKSTTPCNLLNINMNNDLFCLIVGFIDGDGSIIKQHKRPDAFLRIKCHEKWLANLGFMTDYINFCEFGCAKTSRPYKNKQGYACLTISNNAILSNMKKLAIELRLPILERKWDNIHDQYEGKRQVAGKRVEIAKKMLAEGKRNKEIAEATGLTPSGVTNLIKRNKLK